MTYAGALPFIASAFLLLCDIYKIPMLGNIDKIISIYGIVIASFMAGVHWGQHLNVAQQLNHDDKWVIYLPITSNINAIILWITFIILPIIFQLIVLIISFVTILWIDKKLYNAEIIQNHYFTTRCIVTLLVVISLLISIICLL